MAGFLVAEEGPLSGLIVRLEAGEEWILGRDPDVAGIVLEDPLVSRRHAICRLTHEGFLLENLSAVNPATQNGKVITEAVLLREGDIILIGSTFFRFTESDPSLEKAAEGPSEGFLEGSALDIGLAEEARWLLKVVAGPNAGAEFSMRKGVSYVIGKDPTLSDVVFQDLSVSRQHARITVDDEERVFIEDLGSRNGVLVNGALISDRHILSSQDLVALGTTAFLVIDREQARETIFSPPAVAPLEAEKGEAVSAPAPVRVPEPKDWKEMVIPTHHLILWGTFGLLLLLGVLALFSLFKAEPIAPPERNETEQLQEVVRQYPDVQFTFNEVSGKLFLVGHVLTNVEKQALLYLINTHPFVESIEDNVVVDEYVWQNMNALLSTNTDWIGVAVYAPTPGHFVLRGYVQTPEQAQALADYVNLNFPYLDRLDNQVVIESNLNTEIQSLLIEQGFSGVTFQLSNGELVLSGRVDEQNEAAFDHLIATFKGLRGIRVVKNFVILTTADTSRVDLSGQYTVTGYSKRDESSFFVVINGKILSEGDVLDGMVITGVQPTAVLLEKDGIKFKINYNLQ
jgi:type III secretion system YscD/HrpQ family protein